MRKPEYFKMIDEKFPKIRKELAKAVGVDRKNYLYIGYTLKCNHCKTHFGIESQYIGVVTCPYCGEYLEG